MDEEEIALDKLIHKFLNNRMANFIKEFISKSKSM